MLILLGCNTQSKNENIIDVTKTLTSTFTVRPSITPSLTNTVKPTEEVTMTLEPIPEKEYKQKMKELALLSGFTEKFGNLVHPSQWGINLYDEIGTIGFYIAVTPKTMESLQNEAANTFITAMFGKDVSDFIIENRGIPTHGIVGNYDVWATYPNENASAGFMTYKIQNLLVVP
jgi:hypothetical protein